MGAKPPGRDAMAQMTDRIPMTSGGYLRLEEELKRLRNDERPAVIKALAEAREGMCQACHVRMRVQIWVEVKKNEQLFQCESCSRVYYYEPPPPTVVVEP